MINVFAFIIYMNIPEISGALTFFYYNNLEEAYKFYMDIMGFEIMLDIDWVKIFKIGTDCHLGIVNSEMGSHKPSENKPVRLQIMVSDAQAWLNYFREKGVPTLKDELYVGSLLNIKTCTVKDPGDYAIEICEYTTPYGV